jgi:predicted N-acetyltransferase YhbS
LPFAGEFTLSDGMTFTISRMPRHPAAIERVAELRRAAFFAHSDRSLALDRDALWNLASRQSDDELGFVAEAEGMLVGTVLLVARELDQYHDVGPWLAGLVVRADWRNQGVGSALARAVEDHARQRGVKELFLYTYDAERFYRALDWSVRERFTDNHGETCTLMVRELGDAGEVDDDQIERHEHER